MKKLLALLLALAMLFTLGACAKTPAQEEAAPAEDAAPAPAEDAGGEKDYSGYTIRIYSNSNSTERTTWLINEAKDAGFTISIDDNSVISGDDAAIQAANENKRYTLRPQRDPLEPGCQRHLREPKAGGVDSQLG